MTTLKAIETTYAGCRFRSRLEARWAVFLDSLGIVWEYEPQGYTVGPDATPYLPDFWLPEMKLWAEVKGQLDQPGLETLIWAAGAAGLALEPNGEKALGLWPWHQRMLVLGSIPSPGDLRLHTRLDVLADVLVAWQGVFFWPGSRGWSTVQVATPHPLNQYVAGEVMEPGDLTYFVDGCHSPFPLDPHPRVTEAYRAARSARFEHGESGDAATLAARSA